LASSGSGLSDNELSAAVAVPVVIGTLIIALVAYTVYKRTKAHRAKSQVPGSPAPGQV
jgi:hypothetical protein